MPDSTRCEKCGERAPRSVTDPPAKRRRDEPGAPPPPAYAQSYGLPPMMPAQPPVAPSPLASLASLLSAAMHQQPHQPPPAQQPYYTQPAQSQPAVDPQRLLQTLLAQHQQQHPQHPQAAAPVASFAPVWPPVPVAGATAPAPISQEALIAFKLQVSGVMRKALEPAFQARRLDRDTFKTLCRALTNELVDHELAQGHRAWHAAMEGRAYQLAAQRLAEQFPE